MHMDYKWLVIDSEKVIKLFDSISDSAVVNSIFMDS